MKAVPFGPTLPDVQSKPPKRMFAAEGMLLPFSTHLRAVGGGDFVSYIFVLTAVGLPDRKPACFVTLESSPFAANQLCAFDRDGSHISYGTLDGVATEENFLKAAFEILVEHMGPLNELCGILGDEVIRRRGLPALG